MTAVTSYVGRFAPSPTGPLHIGSIIAALGSYLDARHADGRWIVRIEDIDTPRVQKGASKAILNGLETLGMLWDGQVIYQSQRHDAYRAVLNELQSREMLYPCICPRKLVKGKPYPGTCRNLDNPTTGRCSIRIKTNNHPISLVDQLQGTVTQTLETEIGDFIVHRSDGLKAYHLAVVTDDEWQGITHIVRGIDLLDSSPRQIYLQTTLGFKTPSYCHLPIAVDQKGYKISKNNHAKDALSHETPTTLLYKALVFLGQDTKPELQEAKVEEIIQWGIENWRISKVPKQQEIPIEN